jgi:hypothetical protein
MLLFNSWCLLRVSNIMCTLTGNPFVHEVLYGMFFIHLCEQSNRWKDAHSSPCQTAYTNARTTYHTELQVQTGFLLMYT